MKRYCLDALAAPWVYERTAGELNSCRDVVLVELDSNITPRRVLQKLRPKKHKLEMFRTKHVYHIHKLNMLATMPRLVVVPRAQAYRSINHSMCFSSLTTEIRKKVVKMPQDSKSLQFDVCNKENAARRRG